MDKFIFTVASICNNKNQNIKSLSCSAKIIWFTPGARYQCLLPIELPYFYFLFQGTIIFIHYRNVPAKCILFYPSILRFLYMKRNRKQKSLGEVQSHKLNSLDDFSKDLVILLGLASALLWPRELNSLKYRLVGVNWEHP